MSVTDGKGQKSTSPRPAPLDGYRVIEMGQVIAAPFAAAMLADFGADVIKIESPHNVDTMRALGPKSGDVSAWWKSISRSKRLISLDWKMPEARSVLERLVRSAHVLIENYRPGVLERNGFSPDVLFSWNPDLVILRISGWGQTGPYAHRPGFGKIAEAFSGVCDLTGFSDGPPVNPGFPLADSGTGLMGAYGVALALLAISTGKARGQVIDLPIYEAPLRMIEFHVPVRTGGGVTAHRNGNRQPLSFALAGAYLTADKKWVTYSAASFSVARRVLTLIAGEQVAQRPEFATMEGICAHDDEIDVLVRDWMAARDAQTVIAEFLGAHAAAGRILDVDDILADEHVRARGNIVQVGDDPCKVVGVVPRLQATPGSVRWLGRAAQGHDTATVLAELGFSSTDVEALERAGAIQTAHAPQPGAPISKAHS